MKAFPLTAAKTVGLATLVAAAVLVPLYGDPKSAPVTHAEWARMLVRALDMDEALPRPAQASTAFSLLSWKSSLTFAGDQFSSGEGVSPVNRGGRRGVIATEPLGTVSYRLAILRSGDYRLRLRLAGDPATRVATEISVPGAAAPTHQFPEVAPANVATWIDVGTTHLDRGPYLANLSLPAGVTLERLEVAPPCVSPVEPPGGWQALSLTTPGDIAVTAIQALDVEPELPPADLPVEIPGSSFAVTGGAVAVLAKATAAGPELAWLRAGPTGVRAIVVVDVKADGLYTLDTYGGEGRGQRWLADACRKAVLCPPLTETTTSEWREILTGRFGVGRHMLAVTLAPGAVVQRIRMVRLKDAPEDYAVTLKRLGFDVGTESPAPRQVAVAAMNFVRDERRRRLGEDRLCGDTIEVGVPVNLAGATTGGGSPIVQPPGPPVVPPVVPPPPPPPPPPPTPEPTQTPATPTIL
jgi:hypothetical protein